jgi:hypothetical protein
MVIVPVGVDHVLYRLPGKTAKGGQHLAGGAQIGLRVDHNHIALANDEEAVRFDRKPGRLVAHCCVDAFCKLLNVKMWR